MFTLRNSKNLIFVLAIAITVFIFGCTQGNQNVYPNCSITPEKCLAGNPRIIENQTYNVSELLDSKLVFLNKEVLVRGELKYQPTICTLMACLAPQNFTGEIPCNGCGAIPVLKEGNQTIELRNNNLLPNCSTREINRYVNGEFIETKYNLSNCSPAEGTYFIRGIFKMENWTINPPVYYIEVLEFTKLEKT